MITTNSTITPESLHLLFNLTLITLYNNYYLRLTES